MLRYIAHRVAVLIPMLFGVSVVVFLMLRLGRGDPALDYLRLSQIPPTDAALAEARHVLGLDRPLLEQYLTWLDKAAHLDFGISFMTRRPVLDEILYYLPATMELAAAALLLTLVISLPLGVWAALNRERWPDFIVRGIAFTGVSLPNFWLGFLLILLFSVGLEWLPPLGRGGIEHLVMPAVAVSLMSLAINARLIRTSMLEVAGQRHVLYARLRGLPESRVVGQHVFYNALLPVITAVGMHIGELIGGTLVVENIFGWPGLGRFAVAAIYSRDYPVLQCFTLLMTTIFVFCNLIVDILYAWLDPRIRMTASERAG